MASILKLAKSYPFTFGLVYSGMKTCGCDLLVQKVIEKREEIDWRRNAAFTLFGFLYLGGVQYAIYVPLFSRLFPNAASFAAKPISEKIRDAPGIRSLFSQLFLDQCIHHPLLYFPAFYVMKDVVTNNHPDPIKAVHQFIGNSREDMIALWKVWVPSTFVNFAFMPMHMRIPWVATTSLLWTCILSAMRGGSDKVPNVKEVTGPYPDSSSFELMARTVMPPPVLDASNAHVLVTVHGPDKPGMVAAVSRSVYDAGGNLTTGKMIKLGGEFAVMLHVECPHEKLAAMRENLHSQASSDHNGPLSGCNIQTRQVVAIGDSDPSSTVSGGGSSSGLMAHPPYMADVRLTGPDQKGLLMKLTEMLARHGLNVEHIQTEQHIVPKDPKKPRLFSCSGIVSCATEPDAKAIKDAAKVLGKELNVTVVIDRIESR